MVEGSTENTTLVRDLLVGLLDECVTAEDVAPDRQKEIVNVNLQVGGVHHPS